jgi:hypothetical protein
VPVFVIIIVAKSDAPPVKPENHQCYLQPVKAKKRRTTEEGNEFLDDDVAVDNDVECPKT